jgi:proliferating cell nuclear antigen
MQGMDTSHCSCFEAQLLKEWFSEFHFDNQNDLSVMGINTIILQKMIGTHSDGQIISISGNDDYIDVSFTGNDTSIDKFFEIPLMDIEQDHIEIESKDSDVDIIISSKKMSDLISQFQIFDEKLCAIFSDESVSMMASGDEGKMQVNISFDDVIEYSISEGVKLQQSYSLKHISMMCLFGKLSEEFLMRFSENRPMEGKYDLQDNSYVTFYLAPKIED